MLGLSFAPPCCFVLIRFVPHCIFFLTLYLFQLLPPVPYLLFSVFYPCKSFESLLLLHLHLSQLHSLESFPHLSFCLSFCLSLLDCLCLSNSNGHRAFKDRREIQREQMFLRCCHTVGVSAVVAPCCA